MSGGGECIRASQGATTRAVIRSIAASASVGCDNRATALSSSGVGSAASTLAASASACLLTTARVCAVSRSLIADQSGGGSSQPMTMRSSRMAAL